MLLSNRFLARVCSGAAARRPRSSYSKPCNQQHQQHQHWQCWQGRKGPNPRCCAHQQEGRSPLDSDEYDEEPSATGAASPEEQHASSSTSRAQEEDPTGRPGGGFVGFFVAIWMGLLSLILQLLSPAFSLGLFVAQPLTHTNPVRARAVVDRWVTHLPQGFWARLHYLWERPVVKSIRITASIANWSVRLPAIAALLLAQGGALASTISFPMLAPLLLGTGMMMNSIKANASFIIPRLGLMVVLLWVLWFFTNVVQTTWVVLCKQGRIDLRTLAGARMITESISLLLAGIVVLSTLGINISGLLLPAGVVLAIASKDLLQNFIAGFFLVLSQPFRLGDKVAISCTAAGTATTATAAAALKAQPGGVAAAAASSNSYGMHRSSHTSSQSAPASSNSSSSEPSSPPGWFEGVCEKVDLRYTVLRDGRRRLMVPNTTFVSSTFMVYDDGPEPLSRSHGMGSSSSSSNWFWQQRSSSPTPEQTPPAAAAGQGGSTGDRSPRGKQPAEKQQQQAGSASPEPAIVEGHMTTQVPPPPGQPVFPGMHFAAYNPGFAFPPVAYPGYPPYPQDPLYSQQQPEGMFASGEWLQHQQQLYQQHGQHHQEQLYQLEQHQQQHGAEAPQEQDRQQQQGQEPQQQQQGLEPQAGAQSVAKGPPGYLPQGFVGPHYSSWGIPVGTLVYGVPGVLPWGSGGPGRPAGQPAGAAPPPPQAAGRTGQQQRQPAQPPQQQQQHPGGPGSSSHSRRGSSGSSSSKDEDNGDDGGKGGGSEPGSGQGVGPVNDATHQSANGSGVTSAPSTANGQSGSAVQQPPPLQQQQQLPQQQQQRQQPLPPHAAGEVRVPSQNIHMAAAAGFGMWGMAPAYPQPPYGLYSRHTSSSSWDGPQQVVSQQSPARQAPRVQEEEPDTVAADPVRHAAAAAEAPAVEGDSQSNLVLAVLQEMSKQQF